uniref:FYVE zinc finger domain-containing protein n=1 Tax=Megaselia scalaris TaxID=36166 RepID=T1GXQ0_MEGSC
MSKLIGDRESLNKHLETLQSDNEYLSGKYLSTSEELELEQINLPQTVVELTELVLKQQTDLIHSRVGCEFEKRKCVEFRDEAQLLRDRLNDVNKEYKTLEKKYQHTKKILEENIVTFKAKEQVLENDKDLLERKQSELNKQISEMRVHIIELQDTNEKLEKSNKDYKQKLKNLQEDLSNSEHVQKDFVKLSQTLQMSLEKFRTADTEVRWKDDDDVANCPNCNILFTVTVRKHHCRHCGETIEESSICKTELKKLGDEYNRLRAENLQLKEELSQKEESAGLHRF